MGLHGKRAHSPDPEEPTFSATLPKRPRVASPTLSLSPDRRSLEPADLEALNTLDEDDQLEAEQLKQGKRSKKKRSRESKTRRRERQAGASALKQELYGATNPGMCDRDQDNRSQAEIDIPIKGLATDVPATKGDVEELKTEIRALKSELQAMKQEMKQDKEAEAEQRKKDAEEIKGMLKGFTERFIQKD